MGDNREVDENIEETDDVHKMKLVQGGLNLWCQM